MDYFNQRLQAEFEELELPQFIWAAVSPTDRPRYFTSENKLGAFLQYLTPKQLALYKISKYRMVDEN